jgi:hypothetical protein
MFIRVMPKRVLNVTIMLAVANQKAAKPERLRRIEMKVYDNR